MTTISYSDVWRDIAIRIPNLGNKCMDSLIVPIYVELRKDYCVCCMFSCPSYPVLLSRFRGSINDKLSSVRIISGNGFNSSYITPMPQLRHRKATLDDIILCVPQPLVMMAFCSKELNGATPQKEMNSKL